MMLVIEYDDNEAIGHDHKYHLYHFDDYHFVANVWLILKSEHDPDIFV